MTAQKQKALFDAAAIIRRLLKTKKPFMDFEYIYGRVEELYNELK